jgi:hypothetical protein
VFRSKHQSRWSIACFCLAVVAQPLTACEARAQPALTPNAKTTPAAVTAVAADEATPHPAPTHAYSRSIVFDLALDPRVSNEFVPAGTGARVSGEIRGAFEYHLLGYRFIEIESHDWSYDHDANTAGISNGTPCSAATIVAQDPGCVAAVGNARTGTYINAASFRERQTAINTGVIGVRHAYLAFSNLTRTNSYGYPRLSSAPGVGLEVLPGFARAATISGSVFYYSDVHGAFGTPAGQLDLSYKLLTYQINAAITKPGQPIFLEIGFIGDHFIPKAFAPAGQIHQALHLGFGVHI